jgi:hypothetical protein
MVLFDLPRAVQLVAQAPELDVVRVLDPVRPAQVGQVGAARVVAVLEEVARLGDTAGAEVDRHHRLDAGDVRPVHELVEPHAVGLDRPPGEVEARGPVLDRTDAVLPAVAGDEVAARVPHQRRAQFPDQV